MHWEQYKETHAEHLLEDAREEAIDTAEREVEGTHLSWIGYIESVVRIKGRCILALFFALWGCVSAWVLAMWHSAMGSLMSTRSVNKALVYWDDVYKALDTVWDAAGGIVDSETILTVADRGNVKKIGALCEKIRAMGEDPNVHPETHRELEHWYESAKVHVREGGKGARREMRSLDEVVERVIAKPDSAPENLMSWRWEKRQAGMVDLQAIRGVRWKQEAPQVTGEELKKRAWKKK